MEVSSLLRDHPEIDVNWTNEYQLTALHAASSNGQAEVVKLLLGHPNINVNVTDISGHTPLSFGCQNGGVSVVEVLLKDPRVDVTLEDDWGGTPLWYASWYGEGEVIEWLVASGRDLGDVEHKKGKWFGHMYTALEIAKERKRTEVVALLERFFHNSSQTRQEVRQKHRVTGTTATLLSFVHDIW